MRQKILCYNQFDMTEQLSPYILSTLPTLRSRKRKKKWEKRQVNREACSSDLHCHLGHLSAATVMVWLYSLISTGIEFGLFGFQRGTNSCLFVGTNTTTIINGRSRILPKVYFLKSLPRGGGTAEEFLGFMA